MVGDGKLEKIEGFADRPIAWYSNGALVVAERRLLVSFESVAEMSYGVVTEAVGGDEWSEGRVGMNERLGTGCGMVG